ncbi:hypothetical protein ACFL2R_01155 [Patescibacteria group bacterium]
MICAPYKDTNKRLCWSYENEAFDCGDGKEFFFDDGDMCYYGDANSSSCSNIIQTAKVTYVDGLDNVGGGVLPRPGFEEVHNPSETPDPGKPNFVVDEVNLKTLSGEEKYIWYKSEEMYIHAWFENKGDADWEGSHDYVEVRYYLSQGLKEDLHSKWERVGTDIVQKYNLELGDELHWEDDRLILANKDSIQPGNYYNIVVCIDRTVDQNNGSGDVDEIHESDNCSTEAVFYVNETPSSNELTKGQIMAIMNMMYN